MEGSLLSLKLVPLLSACFLIAYSSGPVFCAPAHLGIHPLDEKYFASEVIKCKDGSKSFARDRINDNFCDCVDGTDEPGTSACPTGKFYCRNIGSAPRFLFSSHVNDRICDGSGGQQPGCRGIYASIFFFFNGFPCEPPHDCCDGSDEYDGSINCPNTCVMGGNVEYKMETHSSTISALDSIDAKRTKSSISLEDLIQKLKGLKIVIILQVVLFIFLVAYRLFRRRVKTKRKHYH